ncbi:hypothetical protein LG293_16205 (plasmid) [Citricoccus nitrophenolicus]
MIVNWMQQTVSNVRRELSSEEGNLAPVVVLSLVAVLVTAMAALAVSASLVTSSKSMAMVDASTEVTLDFSQQIQNRPKDGYSPGDPATVTSTKSGLTRQQGLILSEDLLITGWDEDGTPSWGPAQGVEGADGVWVRSWGTAP